MDLMEYIETREYTQIVVLSMLRKIGRIKLEEVAEAIGVSKNLLSLLEAGKREVSQKQIKEYSYYIQDRLRFRKSNLYEVLTILSENHRVTDAMSGNNPIDFLYAYLKKCCD